MLPLLLLLLPVAAVSSWLAGYRYHKSLPPEPNSNFNIPPDYLLGLNYLINEEPDKAVDVFIKMLEVNSDTVETHLALGNLFRKRGEVARAIRIHQNLIARPQLDKQQRIAALSELAQDYLKAGVLDRAERLFWELINLRGETVASLHYLLHIYQQQKDWSQAINIAQKLHGQDAIPMAHFYCELAEQAYANGYFDVVQENVKRALEQDSNCVRANIIKGKSYFVLGEVKKALRAYKEIVHQDPDFITEIIAPLETCYAQLGQELDLAELLNSPNALVLTDYIRKLQGDTAAITFVVNQIQDRPTLQGLYRLLELYISTKHATSEMLLVYQSMGQLLAHKPSYRCICCGFSGKKLHWQCPSCQHWGVIKPIHGFGE